jgi:hypothetical protein
MRRKPKTENRKQKKEQRLKRKEAMDVQGFYH